MKRTLIILAAIALIFLLVAAPLVFAEENESHSSGSDTTKNSDSVRTKFKTDIETLKLERNSYKEAKKAERAEALKTKTVSYAEKQINVRLKVLTEQEKRLSSANCARVTSVDVKTPVTTVISTLRTDLNTALTKIKAAESSDIARAELKAAIEKTRVFMYINPAISGLCRAGRLMDKITDRFDPLVAKLKEKQVDTTNLEKELTSAKASLNSAIDTYKKVLSNPGSASNKDLLNTAKSHLQAAKTALSGFKSQLSEISVNLKAKNSNETNSEDNSTSAPIQSN